MDLNDKISEEMNFIQYKKMEDITNENKKIIKIWVFYKNEQVDQNSINFFPNGKIAILGNDVENESKEGDLDEKFNILYTIINDRLEERTKSFIKNEDWGSLSLILEKEPKQIFFYSELLENQIKNSQILKGDIFEPIIYKNSSIDKNSTYYRFKPSIEFIIKLIRINTNEFTPEFKNFLCESLFSRLKNEFGYSSTLDLFLDAFLSEILNNFMEKIINYPNILEKLIKNNSNRIAHLYPSILSNKNYELGFSLVIQQPILLEIYKSESYDLIKNIIIYEEQYTQLIQLLDKYNPDLIPVLEDCRRNLKETFYNKLINSQKDTIDLDWFSKNIIIFRYTLYMFSDTEFSAIIQKIIDLGYTYTYEDKKTVWMHLLLLEIVWYKKVELFWNYLEDLVHLNHFQVVTSCFLQQPERIRHFQELIIEKLGSFTIDLLERRYSAFNVSNPIDFFKRMIEKNKNYSNKIIQIFFENNKEFILDFKEILLKNLRNIASHTSIEDKLSYYHISGFLDYIYYYHPKFKPDIDKGLINKLFELILNTPTLAESLYYVHFLRDNFNILNSQLQKKILSQLVKNKCIPCIEYYLTKNVDLFSQNIDIILEFHPLDETETDNFIKPLEYIIRKKYTEEREIVNKILEHIEKLTPSRKKAELYLLLNKLDNSKDIFLKLIENSIIIPNSILNFLDYQIIKIESVIESEDVLNLIETQELLIRIETLFYKFNSSDSRQREFNIKRNYLKARLDLYKGFQLLQGFECEQAQETFLEAHLLFKKLSEIDDKNTYNINLFRINSDLSVFFYQNIPTIKRYLKEKKIENANKFIQKHIKKIFYSNNKLDFQLKRQIDNSKMIKFDLNSQVISQFKSESPINFCTSPPLIINKRILDENGIIFIEWDKNENIIKSNSVPVSKRKKKYILELRFDDKERDFNFKSEIEGSQLFEEMSIKPLIIKAGLISYEIILISKTFFEENFINIMLTENNICGFQINIRIPVISKDQEEKNFKIFDREPKSFEEVIDYYNPYIKSATERFRKFNPLEGGGIDERRIISWLKQFEKLEWVKYAIKIIDRVEFFDRYRLRKCFEELFKKYLQNVNFKISNLGNSRDSSSIMNNITADFLMDSNYSMQLSDILEKKNHDVVSIVFFDDIIQSGKQARTIFQEWFGQEKDLDEHHVEELTDVQKEKFKKFHIYIFFAFGLEKGIKNLRTLLERLGFLKITIVSYFNDNLPFQKCFHPASNIFLNPEDLKAAEEMCKDIGYQLFSDKTKWSIDKKRSNSLGYGNEQGLIVTFWNVPTTSLPILWKKGMYNGKIWQPLFFRRSKK